MHDAKWVVSKSEEHQLVLNSQKMRSLLQSHCNRYPPCFGNATIVSPGAPVRMNMGVEAFLSAKSARQYPP